MRQNSQLLLAAVKVNRTDVAVAACRFESKALCFFESKHKSLIRFFAKRLALLGGTAYARHGDKLGYCFYHLVFIFLKVINYFSFHQNSHSALHFSVLTSDPFSTVPFSAPHHGQ